MKKTIPIILDCDPGHDDAIAIMLCGNNERFDLRGITTVAGNQTIEKTTYNALKLCEHLNISTKVYKGAKEPIVSRVQKVAKNIHGESGLDGPVLKELTRTYEKKVAVLYIADEILNSKEKITMVITGPMTNFALALKLYPEIKENIERVVFMGGSYQLGNITPAAEFNIYCDPEAADVVFRSGIPLTMIGLDVTRKVLCLPEIMKKAASIGGVASKLFDGLMGFFNKTQKEIFGWEGAPLHDPLTIAYLIDESVIKTKEVYAEVDTTYGSSRGRTNCDMFNLSKNKKNVNVAIEVDVEKFWNIVYIRIESYL